MGLRKSNGSISWENIRLLHVLEKYNHEVNWFRSWWSCGSWHSCRCSLTQKSPPKHCFKQSKAPLFQTSLHGTQVSRHVSFSSISSGTGLFWGQVAAFSSLWRSSHCSWAGFLWCQNITGCASSVRATCWTDFLNWQMHTCQNVVLQQAFSFELSAVAKRRS